MNVGAHGHLFYSAFKFKTGYELSAREVKDVLKENMWLELRGLRAREQHFSKWKAKCCTRFVFRGCTTVVGG